MKDNILLIIPNNIKEYILNKINDSNKLLDIKIMTIEELITKYTFDYDNNTVFYLMNKLNLKIDIILTYLNNMKYLEDKIYKSSKLNKLNKLKQELIDNKLLIFDNLFKKLLKQKNIVIYGYDYITKYQNKILDEIKKITNIEIINKPVFNNKLIVNEFDNIDDEVEFVATKIIDLINNNVSINNIKIVNPPREYEKKLIDIFKFYNIPLNLKNEITIYETKIGKKFIKFYEETNSISESVTKLKENITDNSINIYNKIIDICNNNDINNLEILIYILRNTKINQNLDNSVKTIELKNNIIPDDLYVFVLGFNQGNIPSIYKDEEFISDIEKDEVLLETTYEKNKIEKEIITSILKSIKNLTITYKLKTPYDTYYKSSLIDDLNIEVKHEIVNTNKYSNIYNKIKLTKKLDNLIKFNEVDNKLGILYNNYRDINYLTYDNKFKRVNPNNLYDYLNNKLLLSYSSLDKFYRCQFRYYISNILKLEKYEETFPIFIGNLFHYILSICFNENFDFEYEWNNYLLKRDLNNKENFLLIKLKKELLFIIKTIKKQEGLSTLTNKKYEEKIFVDKSKNIKITFMGIVDKIMYKNENNTVIAAIIDYKTGTPEINLNNSIYGIEMQLPIYLYLVKNKFSNIKFAGFYLQKILNNETVIKLNENYDKQKEDNLKLQGFSNSDEVILEKFDITYKDSEVIKSMKLSSKGFYAYSKVINDEKINKLIDLTDNKINDAIDKILQGDFKINPKKIGTKNIGCEFCKFRDLCFMTEKDIINLEEKNTLEII